MKHTDLQGGKLSFSIFFPLFSLYLNFKFFTKYPLNLPWKSLYMRKIAFLLRGGFIFSLPK